MGALIFFDFWARIRQPNAPAPQDVLVGQDRVGPSSKIWASRNNSGLGRINGSSLARAVGVYGRLRDLRELFLLPVGFLLVSFH